MFSLDCTVTSQNATLKADYFLSAKSFSKMRHCWNWIQNSERCFTTLPRVLMTSNPVGSLGKLTSALQQRGEGKKRLLPRACFQGNVFTEFCLYLKLAFQVWETIVIKLLLRRCSAAAFAGCLFGVLITNPHDMSNPVKRQSSDVNAARCRFLR